MAKLPGLLCLWGTVSMGADGPGLDSRSYDPGQVGSILSYVDTGAAISGVSMHRGYLIAPMGADHGGGLGAGCLTVFDVSNLSNPVEVFDSRDDAARYQNVNSPDYFGDFAEMHHISISGDLMLVSERHTSNGGFSILDLAPLYDESPATEPSIVSRYIFPGGSPPSNYDGYSFAPAWQGSRYVYAPTGSGGLFVVDTSNPAQPVLLKHMARSELSNMTLRSATVIGNLLILNAAALETTFSALVMDVSDPADPKQISSFSGPLGYQGFVYGGSFYGLGKPIIRHDFSNPQNVVATTIASGSSLDMLDRQEYGFGKDEHLYIGHYPGGTKWLLSGNTATYVNRVDSGVVPADDHAFITPLGNVLAITTDHNNPRKLVFGVHDAVKDTRPPVVNFHSPPAGATNVNLRSRVGLCFTDFIDAASATTENLRVRVIGQEMSIAGNIGVKEGIVNFVPDADLAANTTYEVFIAGGGLRDYAGNAVPADQVVFRFSTGQAVSEYSTRVVTADPAVTGSTVDLHLDVNNIGGQQIEHSWDFGDGSAATAFGSSVDVSHTYTTPGNHVVTVRTRMIGQTYATAASGVQVIHRPIPVAGPVRSSTIMMDAANGMVWNVNPDNDSVSGIRTSDNTRVHETPVGDDPKSLAAGPGDTLWVANKGAGSVSVINRTTGAVVATHPLPPGSEPHGIVAHPSQPRVYVSLEGSAQVVEMDTTTGAIVRTIQVGAWPRSLALDPIEGTLWISHFISPEDSGKVTAVDLASFTSDSVVNLSTVHDPDTASGGMGLPNYLGSLAISPDYSHIYVPAKKDNIFRGARRNGLDLTFEHAVRSMASSISLPGRTESVERRLDFDNSDFVTSLVYSPKGNQVFFVSSGSSFIWVIDAYDGRRNPFSIGTGGLAPDGLAISPDGSRLYVHNFMSRTVTVLGTSSVCSGFCGISPLKAIVSTVTTDALAPDVLLGKQIFYNSEDPRLSSDSYMSCASCHLDGGHDGRVWDFSGMGEGFRNTIDLNGRGIGHGPLHWTANFDEVHDFEGQIRDLGGGSGLMSDADYNRGTVSRPLGQAKAGFSNDLDALAAYVTSLTSVGRSPFREAGGGLTADGVAGREIFREESCASCHSGTAFTDSASIARHEVGTLTGSSGERLGGPLDGLDTPTLRGLWKTAPYLHDGSAATLRAVLTDRDISGRHANLFHRSGAEIDQLVSYLMQIDDLELSAPAAVNQVPVISSPAAQVSTVQQGISLAIAGSDPDGGAVTFQASGLPDGLGIDATTGVISGAPSTVADYTVHVSIRDAAGASATTTFSWQVLPYVSVPPHVPGQAPQYRHVKFISYSTHDNSAWTVISEFNVLDENLQPLSRGGWVVTTDSEETAGEDGRATRAFDGSLSTFWHTRWSGGNPPPHPHHLTIDMLTARPVGGFSIAPRQDAAAGRVKDWELQGSHDGVNWVPIKTGTLASTYDTQSVDTRTQPPTGGYRYVKFDALTPHDAFLWAVVSEFNVLDANGAPLDRAGWVVSADSEETAGEDGRAARAFDGSTSTFWHTRWSGDNLPDFPHHLIVDMLSQRQVGGFSILPRQNAAAGRVKDWRFHGSNDGVNWTLLGSGTLASTSSSQSRFTGGKRGYATYETWNGITGTTVDSLLTNADYPAYPAAVQLRSSFEAPANAGTNFGARMRAYLVPPVTGTYHLWIASDDDSVLKLSPSFEESRAIQIASVPQATNAREWDRHGSQKSAAVQLVANRLYYIEALHREGNNNDHLAVGWTGPGINTPVVIPGQYLMPVGWVPSSQPLTTTQPSPVFVVEEGASPGTPVGTAQATNPVAGQGLAYQITGGNAEGKFAINSASGLITVAGDIDYETKSRYQLVVVAANAAGESVSIRPTITVSNRIETNEEAVRLALTAPGAVFEGHGNPALIGFASDPDGDGVANAFEILFGSDAGQSGALRPIRFVPVVTGGETRMAYEFEVAIEAADEVSFRCLGSSDLKTWSPLSATPQVIGEANGLRTYRVVDDLPIGDGGRRMMRIAVVPEE